MPAPKEIAAGAIDENLVCSLIGDPERGAVGDNVRRTNVIRVQRELSYWSSRASDLSGRRPVPQDHATRINNPNIAIVSGDPLWIDETHRQPGTVDRAVRPLHCHLVSNCVDGPKRVAERIGDDTTWIGRGCVE